ncbi:hypothetical protein, partial [Aeromonas enteropelogenes]|uniref:hypothetical protein n=1 Tax=Aeromonas enteropelogenes TaxID=29489 RepID=UPI003F742792
MHNRFSILMICLTAQIGHQIAPNLRPAVLKGGIIKNSGRRSPLLLLWQGMTLSHPSGLTKQVGCNKRSVYGDGIHLTVAHKREWSYGFKPDNKT